jgi:hypothetical protein
VVFEKEDAGLCFGSGGTALVMTGQMGYHDPACPETAVMQNIHLEEEDV